MRIAHHSTSPAQAETKDNLSAEPGETDTPPAAGGSAARDKGAIGADAPLMAERGGFGLEADLIFSGPPSLDHRLDALVNLPPPGSQTVPAGGSPAGTPGGDPATPTTPPPMHGQRRASQIDMV